MTPALRLALRMVARGCRQASREEIEGDLLEIHARRRSSQGLARAERGVLWEAVRSVLGRPSAPLVQRGRRLALVLTAGAAGIAYLLLVSHLAEPVALGWPMVILGTALELLFWILLFAEDRDDVEQQH